MAGPLEHKVAIVTGGGRGLGRAMVLGLAKAGAEARAATGADRVLPLTADVTREEDCAGAVAAALQHFGALS